MSRIADFFKKCKLPFLWTLGYIFTIWAILHILFNFELFSRPDWIRASQAHLHGFGGFVFCLIVLSGIPLYIATTVIVVRTQKPLLAIPAPKFIVKILEKIFPKQLEPVTPETNPELSQTNDTQNTDMNNIPAEMRGVFMRARLHPNRIQAPICNACSVNPNVYPTQPSATTTTADDMPLPPDFDFDNAPHTPAAPTSAPMFQDIDLGFDTNTDDISYDEPNPIIDYLVHTGRKFDITDNDIIITDTAAIAVHNDNDFWIMDEPIWFASGKTRPSPIEHLRTAAAEHNVRAVLYLGATNIMKYDEKITEWEQSGIHIVTQLTDL